MAKAPTPGYQAFWSTKRAILQSDYHAVKGQIPDRDAQYRQLFKVLCTIEDTASFTPAKVGESPEWATIVEAAEENAATFCQALSGKPRFSALHGLYTVTLGELKALLKNSAGQKGQQTNPAGPTTPDDGFQEVRRRKRQSSGEAEHATKKPVTTAPAPPKEAPTRNFFAPLRTEMDTETSQAEATTAAESAPQKTCRPPPIILTSTTNLIQLQKQLKNVVKDDF
jgi:hypothetical protein